MSYLNWPLSETRHDARRAEEYLDAVFDLRYKHLTHSLLALRSGEVVLDLGCGVGVDAAALREAVGEHGRVVGVDRDPHLVEAARLRSGLAADFHVADGRALGFPDGSFDAVLCDRVLQHSDDVAAIVREALRVTADGGRLVFADPIWETLKVSSVLDVSERAWGAAARGAVTMPDAPSCVNQVLRAIGVTGYRHLDCTLAITRYDSAEFVLDLPAIACVIAETHEGASTDILEALRARDRANEFVAKLSGRVILVEP